MMTTRIVSDTPFKVTFVKAMLADRETISDTTSSSSDHLITVEAMRRLMPKKKEINGKKILHSIIEEDTTDTEEVSGDSHLLSSFKKVRIAIKNHYDVRHDRKI